MTKSFRLLIVLFLAFLAISCEKITFDAPESSWEFEKTQLGKDGVRSEQQFRPNSMDERTYQGAINAVKKTYQLTNITFSPRNTITYNTGTYQPNDTYKGMVYSSVKEIGTYVGNNISFHTFMTAIHNPRSKIYTDRIDKSPYHGTNCRSYYGVVCSSLVSYALGLFPIHASYDFVASEEMEELDYANIDDLHIADVLWRSGHVALITNVVRDNNDNVVSLEISEAIQSGCRRYSVTESVFKKSVASKFEKALRYKHLDTNIYYTPVSEFVTVFDESPVPFEYNDDICADKGDRSCYFVGEDVVLNLSSSEGTVEIYKDGALLSSVDVDSEDLRLTDLDYGFYQARITDGNINSGFTSWIMVNKRIISAAEERKVYFESANATPVSISFCSEGGGRGIPASETICRRFTEEEITSGYMDISSSRKLSPFFMIVFSTEFGNISTTPIKWEL